MRFYLIFIFLLSLFITNKTFSQDSLSELDLQYFQLVEDFYLESDPNKKGELLLAQVSVLKEQKKFHKGLELLNEFRIPVNDSLKFCIGTQKALLNFAEGNDKLALLEIQKLEYGSSNLKFTKDYQILKVIVFTKNGIIEELQTKDSDKVFTGHFDSLKFSAWIEEYKNLKLKKPSRAEWLSTFVPGLGQTYSGYVGEGIAGFGLNAIALGFIGYNFFLTNYLTVFTVGSGVMQKFYFGGRRRAYYLAEKRNEIILNSHLKRLENCIK